MLTRAISGLVFVLIVVGAILGGELSFSLLIALVSLLAVNELYQNLEKTGKAQLHGLQKWFIAATVPLVLLYAAYQFGYITQLVYLMPVLVFLPLIALLRTPVEQGVATMAYSLMGFAYVLFSFLMLFHWAAVFYSYEWKYLLGGIIAIWANDVFAYLTGKAVGRTKLIERISPNKTREGTAGGLLFAVLAAMLYAWFMGESPAAWAGFGLLCGICATLGDLVESVLKRSLGVKDMGRIMPGHGGVLDRFDALMFAAPFGAAYIQLVLI
ncbi:hypothetical protein GC194_10045 [bacterium]|nr:hypothetical protein [bacterium]